jgi:hypothetical protein
MTDDERHAEANAIVRALAKAIDPGDNADWCPLCLSRSHAESCPWLRARRYVEGDK